MLSLQNVLNGIIIAMYYVFEFIKFNIYKNEQKKIVRNGCHCCVGIAYDFGFLS